MVFIISGSGHRTAVSYDGSSSAAPLLHVEYDGGAIETRIDQGTDDAEEASDGSISLISPDLELTYDGQNQIVGLRFNSVALPNGATITKAYIKLTVDEGQSEATSLVIQGEAADNPETFTADPGNISGRTRSTVQVEWPDLEEWSVDSRMNIGKEVIGDLIKDDSLSWGFGSWSERPPDYDGYDTTGTTSVNTGGGNYTVPSYPSGSEYFTRIQVGTAFHDATHQQNLLDAIDSLVPDGGTPLGPSMLAAKDYFSGLRADEVGSGNVYVDPVCQPKVLINITDGIGYLPHTSADYMEAYTHMLADEDISTVGVGFGLDDASQLQRLASVSNARGDADKGDNIYPLHEKIAGVGQPFMAGSKGELMNALSRITSSLKSQVFHGSAPAPTTSIDSGNVIISAKFMATDWTGDLSANNYNRSTGALGAEIWSAAAVMPTTISAYTGDGSGTVIPYSDSSLEPFYQCKPLGDIINSTPIIVEKPPFYYPFDDYNSFRGEQQSRTPLVYVGANDGALHAFNLADGVEQWRYYPESLHGDLDAALIGTNKDMCNPLRDPAGDYCHKYFVDGSPVAADVYDGSDWSTILVTGLGDGGASYFALDVTGGSGFDGNGNSIIGDGDDTTLLWEFTDSDLGLATNEPAIARVAGAGTSDHQWGIFFGSGYSADIPSQQATKEAYLYGLKVHDKTNLWAGTNKIKITSATLADDTLSSPLVVDRKNDYLGDLLYTGNLYGSMYRVADIGEGDAPTVTKLFDLGRSAHENPIRAKAAFAYAETSGDVWIYFGTGKYENSADKITMEQQYFAGLKDNEALRLIAETGANPTYSWNPITDVKGLLSHDINAINSRRVTIDAGATKGIYRIIKTCTGDVNSWLLKLDNSSPGMMGSERVISEPLVVGGTVFFTTFIPDENICSGNGEAWLYALKYDTGCSTDSAFDINDDGRFNADDMVEVDGTKYQIAGIYLGSGQPSKPVLQDNTIFVSTTGEGLKLVKVNIPENRIMLKSWREK